MFTGSYNIKSHSLKKTSHVNLLRLAKYIGLKYALEDMSHGQLARLVKWRLTRHQIRR